MAAEKLSTYLLASAGAVAIAFGRGGIGEPTRKEEAPWSLEYPQSDRPAPPSVIARVAGWTWFPDK